MNTDSPSHDPYVDIPALPPLPHSGMTPVCVLTIAGSDSGGCAGIQSELRTFTLTGVHALTAITAITAQNSLGVQAIHEIPTDMVMRQIDAVHADIGFNAVKTGVLISAELMRALSEKLSALGIGNAGHIPLLVDPIIASAAGNLFIDKQAVHVLCSSLIPLASIVTPNLDEVQFITGITVNDYGSAVQAAKCFFDLGAYSVLLKGGHGKGEKSIDYFFSPQGDHIFTHKRILNNGHDHGAGDTLAAAICSALAYGLDLISAVKFAIAWAQRSVASAYPLGHGRGPVSALWRLHSDTVKNNTDLHY